MNSVGVNPSVYKAGVALTLLVFTLDIKSVIACLRQVRIVFSQFFEDNTCAQLARAICSKFYSPVFSTNVSLVLMANFNPCQFTNSHYPPDYSQYGDGLFSPFSSQMFSHDSQPSTSQPSSDRAFEHGQPIQPSPVPSAASGGTKKSNQRERWGFDDEKVLLQLWADNIEKVESKDGRNGNMRIAMRLSVAKIFSAGIQFRIDVSCLATCGLTLFKS